MDIKVEEVSFYMVSKLKRDFAREGMRLNNEEGTIWLGVTHNGDLVGVCAYRPTRKGILLKSSLVLPLYRGLGIYRKLFDERLRRAKLLNPKRIYAYCTKNSKPVYLKNGFSEKRKIYSITHMVWKNKGAEQVPKR